MGFDERSADEACTIEADKSLRYNLPTDKLIVGYVGAMGITNALDSFFECAASMQSFPKIHFLVVGDGDLRGRYVEHYASLANLTLAPKVIYMKIIFFSVKLLKYSPDIVSQRELLK